MTSNKLVNLLHLGWLIQLKVGRMFLKLKYTNITKKKNTYIRS